MAPVDDLSFDGVAEFDADTAKEPGESYTTIAETPTADTPSYDAVVAILASPLDPANIKERKGFDGTMLKYLDGKYVIKTLNRIFGYGHWGYTVSDIKDMALDPETNIPMAVSAVVRLWVEFPGEWGRSEFSDTGFGENPQPGYWDAEKRVRVTKPRTWGGYEMARKGAVTDALKRCAANLGDQFGLSLKGKDDSVATPTNEGTATASSNGARSAAAPASGSAYACEICGEELRGYTAKSGKTYTAADMAKFSIRDTQRVLCYTHKQEHLDTTR